MYLLHNELARKHLAKIILVKDPETRQAICEQFLERIHLCGKTVGRHTDRGEKPNKPSDSWLSRPEF